MRDDNSMENASQARVQITPLQQGLTGDTWLSKQLWQMLSAKINNKQTLICAQATNFTNLRLRLNLKQLDVSNQHTLHQASDKHLNQSNWYAAVTSKRTARQGRPLPNHVTQTLWLKHEKKAIADAAWGRTALWQGMILSRT